MKDYQSYVRKGKIRKNADKAVVEDLIARKVIKRSQVIHDSGSSGLWVGLGVLLVVFAILAILLFTHISFPSPPVVHQYPTKVVNVTNEVVKERLVTSNKRDCLQVRDVASDNLYLRCEQ